MFLAAFGLLFSFGDLMPGLRDCSDLCGLYVMDINPQCLFFTSVNSVSLVVRISSCPLIHNADILNSPFLTLPNESENLLDHKPDVWMYGTVEAKL